MDKVTNYRNIILGILKEYATFQYLGIEGKNEVILDKENERYQVVTLGWQGYKRIHDCPLHFDIINGKVWIQNDQTEEAIANELLEKGVPKEDIILAYESPFRRKELGFPVS